MSEPISRDDNLVRRLPLPLARLYEHALNARSPLNLHQAAYYLWEATLRLLSSAAIIEYVELEQKDAEANERLKALARPALGHWWEFSRLTVHHLAASGDADFLALESFLLGRRTRNDLPLAAGLSASLSSALEGRTAARTTVKPRDLFDQMVQYRTKELGHGAFARRPGETYERMGRALLAGTSELLSRFDPLAGRSLVHVVEVKRDASGGWIIEWDGLSGSLPWRKEPLRIAEPEATNLPRPKTLYLVREKLGDPAPATSLAIGSPLKSGQSVSRFLEFSPLAIYDEETQNVAFLNVRRGADRCEYLCYVTGRSIERQISATEERKQLSEWLGIKCSRDQVAPGTAELPQSEEPVPPAEQRGSDRRIGEFELISRLGEGGMGVVYRARQPSLDRLVALKCLLRPGNARESARFTREIHVLGLVQHPQLVKVYHAGAEGDRYFYAMELIEGATLGAVCEKLSARTTNAADLDVDTWSQTVSTACDEARRAEAPIRTDLPDVPESPRAPQVEALAPQAASYVETVVELIRQIASAVQALHHAGVIHRDIKPGNIMVTEDGRSAVLIDLGLAQLADEMEGRLTRTREFVGTLRYASPEQLLNLPLDARSDVYSLGATLWELLTLKPLFGATAQTPIPEVMKRIQSHESESVRKHNRRVPTDLAAVIDKCLEKDARHRYATADEVARELDDWLAGKPVRARRRTSWYVARKWMRRHKRALSGVALLVALQFALFWYFVPGRDVPVSVNKDTEPAKTKSAAPIIPYRLNGRLYMLAIGIASYADAELNLKYAAQDAEAIARAFETADQLFGSVQVRRILNAEATQTEIVNGLEWLSQETTSRDVAILFFSGRGTLDEHGTFFLLPADFDAKAPLAASGVSLAQIKDRLEQIAGRVFFQLDAHAGGLEGGNRPNAKGLTDELVRKLSDSQTGVLVMAASTGRETSRESDEHKLGCFTVALSEGILGKADRRDGNSIVLWNELQDYVIGRVQALTAGKQHPNIAKPDTIPSFPVSKTRTK